MNLKQILYQLFLYFCITFQIIHSETIVIEGTVRHLNTYQEIPFVNIYIEDHSIGTSSNLDGTFTLKIPESKDNLTIIFEHVSFDTMRITLSQALQIDRFYMIPRIIQLNPIAIEAQGNYSKIQNDIPQPVSVISSKNFDIHGYVDAGDLLKNEQSIQVEEELSGKKTVALRAGNSDDVIILYNGIKMNSLYDNIFDLSLINIEDIQHFEIIKGSNTSLYGPEAFSGVVNIVPKTYKNYNIRFTQRIGTYASGDWNLQLNYNNSDRFNVSYSYKQGSTKREYDDEGQANQLYLNNKIYNHSASFVYNLNNENQESSNNVGLLYLQSDLTHTNDKFNESLENMNRIISLFCEGTIWRINHFNLTSAYQWYNHDNKLIFDSGRIDQKYRNNNFNLNLENKINFSKLDIYLAYQFEQGELSFIDNRGFASEQNIGIESASFKRNEHGIASILKFHVPTNSNFLKLADLDLSYRYDYVDNDRENIKLRPGIQPYYINYNPENTGNKYWSESTLKFSSQLLAENRYLRINSYLNFGSNVKFPTLFQQISSPASIELYTQANEPYLGPEKNRSLEIGTNIIQEINEYGSLNGWQLEFNYFKNYYDNKFRMYYSPGIPIAFYDNVSNADISGLESNMQFFIVNRKITLDMGLSKYFISEKAAFPFKSDFKYVINFLIDHAGFSFRAHGFYENEQTAWIRNTQNQLWEVTLPGYSNLDIHLNKTVELKRLKIFLNISARNLFDSKTVLEGIAIRDRRYYVTFGVQY